MVEVPGPSSRRPLDRGARHPWRATRGALLAGGAIALLSGCGEEDVAVTAPADALLRQLAAERALVAATARLPGPEVREIHTRARARAAKLVAAVSAEGGNAPDEPRAEVVAGEQAVARAQAAIVAHVTALPSLTGRELRKLGAQMVIGAAADTAVLGAALGVPVHDPFPGTPA